MAVLISVSGVSGAGMVYQKSAKCRREFSIYS